MIGEEKTKRIEDYLLEYESKQTDRNVRFVNLDLFSEISISYTVYYSLGKPNTVTLMGNKCKDIYNILLEK